MPSKHRAVPVRQHSTSLSASGTARTGLFDHEDEGIMTLKNIRNNLPNDTVAHPRMLESSAIPLCDPQILRLTSTTDSSRESWCEYFLTFSRIVVVKESMKKSCDVLARQRSVMSHRTFSSTTAKTINLATFKYQSVYPLLPKYNSHSLLDTRPHHETMCQEKVGLVLTQCRYHSL